MKGNNKIIFCSYKKGNSSFSSRKKLGNFMSPKILVFDSIDFPEIRPKGGKIRTNFNV